MGRHGRVEEELAQVASWAAISCCDSRGAVVSVGAHNSNTEDFWRSDWDDFDYRQEVFCNRRSGYGKSFPQVPTVFAERVK